MAVKKKVIIQETSTLNKVSGPKYVKPANQWCVTEFKAGKQTQHWFGKDQKDQATAKVKSLASNV